MITLPELKSRLAAQYDEVELIDLLEVDATDIVEAFSDVIEERMEYFIGELEEFGYEGE